MHWPPSLDDTNTSDATANTRNHEFDIHYFSYPKTPWIPGTPLKDRKMRIHMLGASSENILFYNPNSWTTFKERTQNRTLMRITVCRQIDKGVMKARDILYLLFEGSCCPFQSLFIVHGMMLILQLAYCKNLYLELF